MYVYHTYPIYYMYNTIRSKLVWNNYSGTIYCSYLYERKKSHLTSIVAIFGFGRTILNSTFQYPEVYFVCFCFKNLNVTAYVPKSPKYTEEYSQTCIKRSPLGQRYSGLILQVTS